MQSHFNRFNLEFRKIGRFFNQFRRNSQFQIDQLSAIVTERVVVPGQFAVVTGGVVAEPDLADQPLILQVAQGIVNGRERDAGQKPAGILKDFVGCQMLVRFMNHLENSLALFRKS